MADRRDRRTMRAGNGGSASGAQKTSTRYVRLPHDLLDSEAFHYLSPVAVKLLLIVWRRHNGRNNGVIPFSRNEVRKVLHCGPAQAGRAFRELQDKGFLRLRRDSGFNVKTKVAREWEITAEDADGRPASKDYTQWRPPE